MRDNLASVNDRVSEAAIRSGRTGADVLVVAISKTWPVEVVQAAVDAGADTLGENRVQGGQAKVPAISGDPDWHLVGHLQRNKAKVAVDLFSTIQSVDSVRLAREIGKHATNAGKEVAIHLQVNTSGEASKFGVTPDDLKTLAGDVFGIEGLNVQGLMTIAANTNDRDAVRVCFSELRQLRDKISADHPSIVDLSMGMTGDFEMAVEEGATIVRVGTAIFGQRN
ncbi:MAG: YggS family pyridoxal phosphate-dependent enzyme [Gemmatimonadetes bacterium]|nr:YggS family pyridoxal phosphate-dependent enzyme [Gemmatimonadota bacterium]